jgi:hypothetical protein
MNAVTAGILIWSYYNNSMYHAGTPHGSSEAVADGYESLERDGLLYVTSKGTVHIKEKGKTLVDYWLNTPHPQEVTMWKVPDNRQ